MQRREIRGAEKRTKGCGEEKTLYFGATVHVDYFSFSFNEKKNKYTLLYIKKLGESVPTPNTFYVSNSCVRKKNN